MTKNTLQLSFLIAVAATCVYFVFFGQQGIIKYYQIAKEIEHKKNNLSKLEQRNESLKSKIERWEKDDFEKEKFARQDLQMSRPDEMVFVTTQT